MNKKRITVFVILTLSLLAYLLYRNLKFTFDRSHHQKQKPDAHILHSKIENLRRENKELKKQILQFSEKLYQSEKMHQSAKLSTTNDISNEDKLFLYWHKYGRDKHYEQCNYDFGMELVKRWREAKKVYCSPNTQTEDETTIWCHRITQTRHVAPDNFCHAHNLFLNFKPSQTAQIEGNDIGKSEFFASGNCKRDLSLWNQRQAFQLELGKFMKKFRERSHSDPKCSKKLRGIHLIVWRDDAFNVFHSLANVVNGWLSLLIMDVLPHELDSIILIDDLPEGPYYELWSAFGKNVFRKSDIQGEVCIENAIIAIPAGSSFMWKDIWIPNPCTDATLMKMFSRFVIQHLGLVEQERFSGEIRVTLSIREHKPGRVIGRRIINKDELVDVIENQLYSPIKQKYKVKLTAIDFATIPYRKQIEIIRNTDIYVGMHGAGMTHLIFLPDEAVVVELFPHGWHQSSMRNLAKYTNKVYLAWQNTHSDKSHQTLGTTVDLEEFKQIMTEAAHIAQSFHLGKGFIPK